MEYPKRLIEVDLPIKRISEHARREKSIRHGHISTLHIWWARRPLAACRAVICAALWPDPADPLCHQDFRDQAAELILKFAEKAVSDRDLADHCSSENIKKWNKLAKLEGGIDTTNEAHLKVLREALLDFIADFANWDNSTQKDYLEISRALTQAAHEALGGIPGTKPLVVDPFAGGGSIPLEALRVGADAFASELNPVAVLINKVVLEYIPKYGQQLAEEVGKWGQWVKEQAEKELAEFYPKDPDGAIPIAYLWARTIQCEGPGCGAEVPLIRSLWLAKKSNRSVALRMIPNPKEKRVDFEIIEYIKTKDVEKGTVKLGSATCLLCGYSTPVTSVRRQLKERCGGTVDARLIAVITSSKYNGRLYRPPTKLDLEALRRVPEKLNFYKEKHVGLLSLLPDEPTPPDGTGSLGGGYRTKKYGIEIFADFFTPRQLLEHSVVSFHIRNILNNLKDIEDKELVIAVIACLAFAADKQIERDSAFCRWISQTGAIGYTFGRQAIPMLWDFVESPGIYSSGGFYGIINDVVETINTLGDGVRKLSGQAALFSATEHQLPDDSSQCVFTDPPYYDSVPYAELSDFFFVWLKRTLNNINVLPTNVDLTPKEQECVVNLIEGKDRIYFQVMMTKSLMEARRVVQPSGIGVIVFAHKSTSGWEAQLQAMIDSGWTITGSWPIDTERPGRLRAQESAALASSIHLVCRPRENPDGSLRTDDIGDWRDVLQELPKRIHEWMPRLASEGVVGADAIFACLGPALEIFSRYSHVEKASGEPVTLKEYLEYVWAAVAKEALGMIFEGADATGFEEDARLTAIWLWTLFAGTSGNGREEDEDGSEYEEDEEKSGKSAKVTGFVLEFDAARKIAQGLGAHLENLKPLVEIKGDKARLLPVSERARYLFGKDETNVQKTSKKKSQEEFDFMRELKETDEELRVSASKSALRAGNTVLDQLHQSMLLFAAGRGEALKRFLVEQGVGRDQRFWGLAQAFSALYPSGSDEKRWVDGVLARKKGLGL